MSEPVKVRFPCVHGRWFRHIQDGKTLPWVWCDGGQTVWLEAIKCFDDPAWREVQP